MAAAAEPTSQGGPPASATQPCGGSDFWQQQQSAALRERAGSQWLDPLVGVRIHAARHTTVLAPRPLSAARVSTAAGHRLLHSERLHPASLPASLSVVDTPVPAVLPGAAALHAPALSQAHPAPPTGAAAAPTRRAIAQAEPAADSLRQAIVQERISRAARLVEECVRWLSEREAERRGRRWRRCCARRAVWLAYMTALPTSNCTTCECELAKLLRILHDQSRMQYVPRAVSQQHRQVTCPLRDQLD